MVPRKKKYGIIHVPKIMKLLFTVENDPYYGKGTMALYQKL